MVRLTWTEPAVLDLDAIADYIALENATAAKKVVKEVLKTISGLKRFPDMGHLIPELEDIPTYQEFVVPPCRVMYKIINDHIFVLHVLRSEKLFRPSIFLKRGFEGYPLTIKD
jgi:toxin ParE1/3/4